MNRHGRAGDSTQRPRDFEATRLWAQRIVSQAPSASLVLLAGADHFPMLSAPGQFESFLREALAPPRRGEGAFK